MEDWRGVLTLRSVPRCPHLLPRLAECARPHANFIFNKPRDAK